MQDKKYLRSFEVTFCEAVTELQFSSDRIDKLITNTCVAKIQMSCCHPKKKTLQSYKDLLISSSVSHYMGIPYIPHIIWVLYTVFSGV